MRAWAVIPVFNRKPETLACLERLAQLRGELPGLRVVLADDGSTDGTGEAVRREHPDTVIVTGRGDWWWTGGMRAGVDEALRRGADMIVCMNDDTLLQPGSLARLARTALEHPGCLVAPWGVDAEGRVVESGYRWALLKGWTSEHRLPAWPPAADAPYASAAAAGACVLIPAAAFAAAGNYAAALPHYHADLEFCVRAGRAGFPTLIEPRARLLIGANTKNADLLGGPVTLARLRWMFRYPSGAYHPRVVLAFYGRTHPWGRAAGALYSAFFLAKCALQLALNLVGLGRRLRA